MQPVLLPMIDKLIPTLIEIPELENFNELNFIYDTEILSACV